MAISVVMPALKVDAFSVTVTPGRLPLQTVARLAVSWLL
jgi:hypothetical protein